MGGDKQSFPEEDATHYVFKKNRLKPPFPEGMEQIVLGMGCFWCSEQLYCKRLRELYSTHVGYAQGKDPAPTYNKISQGTTGHSEVVRLVYDPKKVSLTQILTLFWENHDPTRLNQQGNDRGTQYRSGVYYYTEDQKTIIEKSRDVFQKVIGKRIVTEIEKADTFHYAEANHQQYDFKPGSRDYNGLHPLGFSMPQGWENMTLDEIQPGVVQKDDCSKC